MKIPKVVNNVNNNKKFQSIFITNTSPKKNPKVDFKAIINSEVAIAFFISKPINITKAGTIKNPPPAPTSPVIPPTINPSKITIE